jgi:hypothetical protein
MSIEDVKSELRWRLARLRPTPGVVKTITSVDDIFVKRYHIRDAKCTVDDLRRLLDLVIAALDQRRRFRQLDCLKVLKRIILRWPPCHRFPPDITDRLFRLYKHYIFSANEDVQWAVSVMLKGQALRNEQVQWLIDHYQDSIHILNRLLRYPRQNHYISSWARKILEDASAFPKRRSELLRLLINNSLPTVASKESSKVVAWAIYHSPASKATKTQLLKQIADLDNFWVVVDIAERSNLPDVIEHLLSEIEGGDTPAPMPANR